VYLLSTSGSNQDLEEDEAVKALAELQAKCSELGLSVETTGRASKEPWIARLRQHFWESEHPGEPLPPQVEPMLLSDWGDLSPDEAEAIEQDQHSWAVQPKEDGVRALLHVERHGIRVTSRNYSETTFRLSEYQDNLPHLAEGMTGLAGTILDGELVCPLPVIDTGDTRTQTSLQAAVAVLATHPDNARKIQSEQGAQLRFHAFDVLCFRDADATGQSLAERLKLLAEALAQADNPFLVEVSTCVVGKLAVHQSVLQAGGEGTVWKRLDQPYESGRRVRHWVKRKRGMVVEGFVTGFKPGTPEKGNGQLVGAVEFSVRQATGAVVPIAWVSSWTYAERQEMTQLDPEGRVTLNPSYLGRRARIAGQDLAARSQRLRHARLQSWIG
jgi:ATP-dependent DNA ligase